MSDGSLRRAGDPGLMKGQPFRPDADPDKWIEQHALPYRERPAAVLRELAQNANDAVQSSDRDQRYLEIAILSEHNELPHGRFHLVVRDSGKGMDEEDLKRELGVLGYSTKLRDNPATIGEFGVGFYSTHAICRQVGIVSRKQGASETAWIYLPEEKAFHPMTQSIRDALVSADFENHPLPTRKRNFGTSVFLNIDLKSYPQCLDWLSGSNLARVLKRDLTLLPTSVFVADFSKRSSGSPVLDFKGSDLRERSLSIGLLPWERQPAISDSELDDLFADALPYTEKDQYPRDVHVFNKYVEDGCIGGLLFAVEGVAEGPIQLFLKGMRVETASDVQPVFASALFGYINLKPGKEQFRVNVLAARDHIIRDGNFDLARKGIEEGCVEFFEVNGKRLLAKISKEISTTPDKEAIAEMLARAMGRNSFHALMVRNSRLSHSLLLDIPGVLREIVQEDSCCEEIKDAAVGFVSKHVVPGVATKATLQSVLGALQENAAEESAEERRRLHCGVREQLKWNREATLAYLTRCGKYLPVTVHRRENLKEGGFRIGAFTIPIGGIPIIDPSAASAIKVLTKGRSEEYFAKNINVRTVVVPNDDDMLLMMAVVSRLNAPNLPLEYVGLERNPFSELAMKDNWIRLEHLFRDILTQERMSDGSSIDVEARGYEVMHVPLVIGVEGARRVLVVNGYNELIKEIKAAYDTAKSTNNNEAIQVLAGMCQELYHHAQSVEMEGAGEDVYYTQTRTTLYKRFLSILQKYSDLRA